MTAAEKQLKQIEADLRFIARAVSQMQTSDFGAQDEVIKAAHSALATADCLRLELEPACEEAPAGVSYPTAA